MQNVIVVLDFLSRVVAVLLALGGVLGFVFRSWVGAWINARFKRQLDQELKTLEHRFALALEEKKAALAHDLAEQSERLKASLASDLERNTRELDEEFRRRAKFFDNNALLYETFEAGYSAIFVELHALDGKYIDQLNEINPDVGKAVRHSYLSRAHGMLVETHQKLLPLEAYAGSELTLRMAKLFADLSAFMADGAKDKERLDELALEKANIAVEVRAELMGGVT